MIDENLYSSNYIAFTATYSDKQIRSHKRFMILCLTNPVGWVIGSLYVVNELFKSLILRAGRDILFGTKVERRLRNPDLINKFTKEMQGTALQLQRPDGRVLEAMYVKAENSHLNANQDKTVLLFTGSYFSYERHGIAMAKAYQTRGYNVLCINYGGFGQSQGSPSQSSFKLDAETAYQYIRQSNPNTEIHAHGYSLGSYPATYLGKNYGLKKVVIDRGFSKISNVTKDCATQLYGRIAGYVLKILVEYVGAMDNIKNVKASSSQFLCGRASGEAQYHVDIIRKKSKNITIIDFQGEHEHDAESVWFQNNTQFWNWLSPTQSMS